MATTKRSFGTILLQIALGLMFIVGGIWTLQVAKAEMELQKQSVQFLMEALKTHFAL